MIVLRNHINEKGTYEIYIVKTGEVVFKCRLTSTATSKLPELKEITMEELKVRKVK